VDGRRVNGNGFLCRDVRAVLEVIVLPFLLSFKPQASQATEILFAYRLVNGGAAADALSIIVRDGGPPIRLGFYVSQNHVFDGGR
jgi:hypothetical protein